MYSHYVALMGGLKTYSMLNKEQDTYYIAEALLTGITPGFRDAVKQLIKRAAQDEYEYVTRPVKGIKTKTGRVAKLPNWRKQIRIKYVNNFEYAQQD